MDWIEVTIRGLDGEGVEAVWEVMNAFGLGGAVVEDIRATADSWGGAPEPLAIKAYIPDDDEAENALRRVREALWHLSVLYPIPEPEVHRLAQQDWAEAWKKYYHRQQVGDRLVIVPAWEEAAAAAGEVVIRLDPGMAFGTGNHPSTRLCLQLMEQFVSPGTSVLDVGTGSGVLAIAAAKLGAGEIKAVDTDRIAVAAVEENVALNELQGRIEAMVGSVDSCDGPFDLILMNILAEVIVDLLPAAVERLRPGGMMILAGIIEEREPLVLEALELLDLAVVKRDTVKDWVGLVVRRGA